MTSKRLTKFCWFLGFNIKGADLSPLCDLEQCYQEPNHPLNLFFDAVMFADLCLMNCMKKLYTNGRAIEAGTV